MSILKPVLAMLAVGAICYWTNPGEMKHRHATTDFILDHCPEIEDDQLLYELVTEKLYYNNYLLYSTCSWDSEMTISNGFLFRVSVTDDSLRRELLFKACSAFTKAETPPPNRSQKNKLRASSDP